MGWGFGGLGKQYDGLGVDPLLGGVQPFRLWGVVDWIEIMIDGKNKRGLQLNHCAHVCKRLMSSSIG